MKDQYFGDVNDFRKYGLLRALTLADRLRVGVCWMLTCSDQRTDGNSLAYLAKPQQHHYRDPELFAWLKHVVDIENDRRTARIEGSGLLGNAVFQSKSLGDSKSDRQEYFSECASLFAGCDLVFFDPDNGLEIRSIPRGRRNSSKFLYWDEVCGTFSTGASVLIYQHFIREERTRYAARMSGELRERTDAAEVFAFGTPHVLFLLASHEHHASGFHRQLSAKLPLWAPKEIIPPRLDGILRSELIPGVPPCKFGVRH